MPRGTFIFYPLLLAGFLAAGAARADTVTNRPVAPTNGTHTVLHRVLWYVPNRLFDVADIVRLRVRAGPGMALNIRATRWAVLYAGTYHSVYAGLPGPREESRWPLPCGFEEEKGLSLLAVDATDTLLHEPVYSDSEFVLGLHVALIGAEAGFDPVELVDLLLGFALVDIRRDDH